MSTEQDASYVVRSRRTAVESTDSMARIGTSRKQSFAAANSWRHGRLEDFQQFGAVTVWTCSARHPSDPDASPRRLYERRRRHTTERG